MPEPIVVIPGVGDVSAQAIWEKVGRKVLAVPGEQAGPIVLEVLRKSELSEGELTLLILVAIETLTNTTLVEGDLPDADDISGN
jgi:hypothetical protein